MSVLCTPKAFTSAVPLSNQINDYIIPPIKAWATELGLQVMHVGNRIKQQIGTWVERGRLWEIYPGKQWIPPASLDPPETCAMKYACLSLFIALSSLSAHSLLLAAALAVRPVLATLAMVHKKQNKKEPQKIKHTGKTKKMKKRKRKKTSWAMLRISLKRFRLILRYQI